MRVQQLNENSFVKVLSPVESKLFERLLKEEKERIEFCYKLYGQQQKLARTASELAAAINAANAVISDIVAQIQALEREISSLTPADNGTDSGVSADYVKQLLPAFLVEEVEAPYTMPTNLLFESEQNKRVFVGYEHFEGARLRKWPDQTCRPGVIKRYTIQLFVSSEKDVYLNVLHDDYFVVYLNGNLVKAMSGNNTSGPAETAVLHLNTGWNTVQFIICNREYGGYYDIGINLTDEVDEVSTPVQTAIKVDSTAIKRGAIKPEHIDSSASFEFRRLNVVDMLGTSSLNLGGVMVDGTSGAVSIKGNLKVDGTIEYKNMQGIGRPVTSMLWLASEVCIPPAQVIPDGNACTGAAAFIPRNVSVNMIDCPSGEIVHPGNYRLYIRMRALQQAVGGIAMLNVKEGSSIIKSVNITAADVGTTAYAIYKTDFTCSQPRIKFELIPLGAADFVVDTIGIQMGV